MKRLSLVDSVSLPPPTQGSEDSEERPVTSSFCAALALTSCLLNACSDAVNPKRDKVSVPGSAEIPCHYGKLVNAGSMQSRICGWRLFNVFYPRQRNYMYTFIL